MLQGPVGEVAYSNTVPAPQPEAEMEPVKAGQTLFTMEMVGAVGASMVLMVPAAVAEQPLASAAV